MENTATGENIIIMIIITMTVFSIMYMYIAR